MDTKVLIVTGRKNSGRRFP